MAIHLLLCASIISVSLFVLVASFDLQDAVIRSIYFFRRYFGVLGLTTGLLFCAVAFVFLRLPEASVEHLEDQIKSLRDQLINLRKYDRVPIVGFGRTIRGLVWVSVKRLVSKEHIRAAASLPLGLSCVLLVVTAFPPQTRLTVKNDGALPIDKLQVRYRQEGEWSKNLLSENLPVATIINVDLTGLAPSCPLDIKVMFDVAEVKQEKQEYLAVATCPESGEERNSVSIGVKRTSITIENVGAADVVELYLRESNSNLLESPLPVGENRSVDVASRYLSARPALEDGTPIFPLEIKVVARAEEQEHTASVDALPEVGPIKINVGKGEHSLAIHNDGDIPIDSIRVRSGDSLSRNLIEDWPLEPEDRATVSFVLPKDDCLVEILVDAEDWQKSYKEEDVCDGHTVIGFTPLKVRNVGTCELEHVRIRTGEEEWSRNLLQERLSVGDTIVVNFQSITKDCETKEFETRKAHDADGKPTPVPFARMSRICDGRLDVYYPEIMGTAFRVSPTHLVTNKHVVKNECSAGHELFAGDEKVDIVGEDEDPDLALLRLKEQGAHVDGGTPIAVFRQDDVELHEEVGCFNYGSAGIAHSLNGSWWTSGVSGEDGRDRNHFAMGEKAEGGSSGCAVMDGRGYVVGVLRSGMEATDMLRALTYALATYAIKGSVVKKFLKDHGIEVEERHQGERGPSVPLQREEVAEKGREITVPIQCLLDLDDIDVKRVAYE